MKDIINGYTLLAYTAIAIGFAAYAIFLGHV